MNSSFDKKIDITLSKGFKPLFSITPSDDTIQLNIDPKNQISTYEFLFSEEDINNLQYSKIYIDFFYENDLEANINSFANNR